MVLPFLTLTVLSCLVFVMLHRDAAPLHIKLAFAAIVAFNFVLFVLCVDEGLMSPFAWAAPFNAFFACVIVMVVSWSTRPMKNKFFTDASKPSKHKQEVLPETIGDMRKMLEAMEERTPAQPPEPVTPPANLPLPPTPSADLEEAKRELAYLKWLHAKLPNGKDEEFWFAAEQELDEQT